MIELLWLQSSTLFSRKRNEIYVSSMKIAGMSLAQNDDGPKMSYDAQPQENSKTVTPLHLAQVSYYC